MLERRQNPIGRAATSDIPRITLGGLRLAVLDIEQTANFMIEAAFPHRRVGRPLYLTSANGEVLARCSTEPMTERLFRAADLINADGQPLVTVSRFKSKTPLPERVATTDLFDVVARKAAAAGLTFYMFGADEDGKRRGGRKGPRAASDPEDRRALPRLSHVATRCAPRSTRSMRWRRTISGSRSAFPMSRPLSRNSRRGLSNVGVIKTSGGLFNFLSGSRARAPQWMQSDWAGMGLAHLAGAAPAVLALFHHQSARPLSVVQPEPAVRHRSDAPLTT